MILEEKIVGEFNIIGGQNKLFFSVDNDAKYGEFYHKIWYSENDFEYGRVYKSVLYTLSADSQKTKYKVNNYVLYNR